MAYGWMDEWVGGRWLDPRVLQSCAIKRLPVLACFADLGSGAGQYTLRHWLCRGCVVQCTRATSRTPGHLHAYIQRSADNEVAFGL